MSHPGSDTLLETFAYWTQCAIATYEMLTTRKSASASDKNRAHNIAKEMVEDLRMFTPLVEKNKKDFEACWNRLKATEVSELAMIEAEIKANRNA